MTYFDRREFAPTREADRSAPGVYRAFAKRVFDLIVVLLIALPASVIVLLAAALVASDGKSPFYFQNRIGKDGKTFRMVKLRSMINGADQALEKHLAENPEARAEWDEKQKLRNDPRITRFGHLLRKSSIDELPQVWNVLRGDMSLVGPRPMMTCQRELYPGRSYYELRPGITGFWQVAERNETSFAERAYFDNAYLQNLSFITDIGVMMKTVAVVIRANGQ